MPDEAFQATADFLGHESLLDSSILHRDISIGNIMLNMAEDDGFFIDLVDPARTCLLCFSYLAPSYYCLYDSPPYDSPPVSYHRIARIAYYLFLMPVPILCI